MLLYFFVVNQFGEITYCFQKCEKETPAVRKVLRYLENNVLRYLQRQTVGLYFMQHITPVTYQRVDYTTGNTNKL